MNYVPDAIGSERSTEPFCTFHLPARPPINLGFASRYQVLWKGVRCHRLSR